MSKAGQYVRVYYAIIDDPRFAEVYARPARLGTWLQLLLGADAIWPASAPLPRVSSEALRTLVDAGIVELVGAGHYRIHGLDAERGRRSEVGRVGGLASGRARNDRPTVVQRSFNGSANEIEPSKAEHSKAEHSKAIWRAVELVETRIKRPLGFGPGSKVWDTLEADIRDFGVDKVLATMDSLGLEHPDAGQLVFSASRVLHPIATPDPESRAQRVRDEADKTRLEREQERRRRIDAGEEV
jgi:hypothetical protein